MQNQKIEYSYYLTTDQEIDQIKITYDTMKFQQSITVKEIEECKYPVHKITFVNRWGAMQDLFFFQKICR